MKGLLRILLFSGHHSFAFHTAPGHNYLSVASNTAGHPQAAKRQQVCGGGAGQNLIQLSVQGTWDKHLCLHLLTCVKPGLCWETPAVSKPKSP